MECKANLMSTKKLRVIESEHLCSVLKENMQKLSWNLAEQRVEWEANGKMCHAAMVSERVLARDFFKMGC